MSDTTILGEECIDCGSENAVGVSCPRCRSMGPANDVGLALVRELVHKRMPTIDEQVASIRAAYRVLPPDGPTEPA